MRLSIALGSINIPASVTTLGGYIFYNCYALTSLTIPKSVTSIGGGLCSFCTRLTAITVEAGNANYTSVDGVLYNGDTLLVMYPIGKNQTSFVFPNTVTSIARSSFRGCTKLQSVTLSESLTSVAGYAFNGCSNLKTINIPSSVTSIEDHTFDDCQNLKTIAIPATVTTIKEGAFASCGSLTVYCETETKPAGWSTSGSSVLNSAVYGVVQSGDYFVRKTNDSEHTAEVAKYVGTSTSIEIPETLEINGTSYSVTGIGDNAFKGSTSLTSITVPATVTEISGSAFSGCNAAINIEGDHFTYEDNILFNKDKTIIICCLNPLTGTYEIPSTVKRISTFNAGSGLTSLTIPSTVETIDSAAFVGATGLTTITTSSQLDFRKALLCLVKDDIKYQVLAKDSVMVVANTYTGTVLIPPFVNAGNYFLVTTIGENAFYNNRNITSVTLPNTITKIPKSAFYSCTKLKAIALGNAVKSIETGAFKYCSLESLDIPKSVVEVGVESFAYNNLTTITTESDADFSLSGLSIIKDNIKYEILDKTSVRVVANNYTGAVEIPASIAAGNTFTVTKIADKAFQNATALTSVTIPESVTQIGQYAFYYCKELTSITIPNGVTKIEHGVFAQCYGLTTLTIPETVNSIAENAFEHCSGLKSIVIPNSVTTIGSYAFNGCNNVETLSYNTTAIGTHFGGSAMLKTIIIGDSIKSISNYAFRNCKALTTISFSDSVKSIGYSAFEGCIGLTSLTIPKSTIYIDQCAFRSCSGLNRVFIPNSVTDMRYGVFDDCTSATIYCEAESEPNGWGIWNPDNLPVVWNSKGDSYSDEFFTFEITDTNKRTAKITGYTGTSANVIIPQTTTIEGVKYTVTSIGKRAFDGNKTLRSVFIPYYIDTVETLAFGNNYYDAKIFCEAAGDESAVPDGWDSNWYGLNMPAIEYNAHIDNGFVYQITDNSNRKAQIIRYMGSKDTLAVPEKINGGTYTINSIDGYAFYECKALKAIDIPSTITEIGYYAFYGSSNIELLTYNTDAIGNNFQNSSSLKKVVIGNNVTKIDDWTFSHTGLEEITFSKSVKTVGSNAFAGCSKLKKADFASIESLCAIEFDIYDSNPMEITHSLYVNGEEVVDAYIPNTVSSIGSHAFSGCSNLTSVAIPKSVSGIGENAFLNCSNMTIFCEAKSQPEEWNEKWNPDDRPVVWGLYTDKKIWQAAITPNNSEYGNVEGGGYVIDNTETIITATPADGYHFAGWNDKNTDNPRALKVTADTALTALFEAHTVVVDSAVAATTTSTGLTEGSHCSVCGKVLVEQIVIPKLDNGGGTPEPPVESDFTYSITSNTNRTVEVTGYTGSKTDITIPTKATIDGVEYTVTGIGAYSLQGCSDITSITIPNTVTTISNNAFVNCTSLASISIPNSVTTIGGYAFYNCKRLTSLTIPKSVTSIGYGLCSFCEDLAKIVVESGNSSYVAVDGVLYDIDKTQIVMYPVGKDARSFDFPETVTSTTRSAFRGCTNLRSVTFNDKLTTIGGYTFNGCNNLSSVFIRKTVTTIGDNAFMGCSNLTIYCEADSQPSGWDSSWNSSGCPVVWGSSSGNNGENNNQEFNPEDFSYGIISFSKMTVEIDGYTGTSSNIVIPSTVVLGGDEFTIVSIADETFKDCDNLVSVTLPSTITSIGDAAFQNCSNLESVSLPNTIETIGAGTFAECSSLKSVEIPNTVTFIGNGAFAESGLTSIVIPNSVTDISSYAFRDCADLASVEIPNSVATIGMCAFENCSELGTVVIPGSVSSIGIKAFSGCDNATFECEVEAKPEGWDEWWNYNNRPVVWKNDGPGTAVAESAAAAVNIYAHGNTIVVENADDEIFVYDAMGKLIYRNTASTVSAEIRINGTGIYVVRVGNMAKRVMVKD